MVDYHHSRSSLGKRQDVRHTYQTFFNTDEIPGFGVVNPWHDHDSALLQGVRSDLTEKDGNGFWDIVQLSEQSLVRINNVAYHADFNVFKKPRDHDLVSISFVAVGEIQGYCHSAGSFVCPGRHASITLISCGDQLQHRVAGGQKLVSATLYITHAELRKLFGVDIKKIAPSVDSHNLSIAMEPAMVNAVIDLANMQYSGKVRLLYTQAKVYELLCLLFQQLQGSKKPKATLRAHDVERLQFAHATLTDNIERPLNINDLAKMVGINRTKLEVGFKQLFGSTIFDYYQQQKMQKAKKMLEDSHFTVAQVAEAIGYEHPGNFTAAFKKFYGVSPKHIKRSSLI